MKPDRRPVTLLDAIVVVVVFALLLTLLVTIWIRVDAALKSRDTKHPASLAPRQPTLAHAPHASPPP
jgi:hypothetical protein